MHELSNWSCNPANNFSIKNCLFGTAKLVRNLIKSKFIYIGGWIVLDGEGSWSFSNDLVKYVLIFGVNNSSSSHTDNWKNNILLLGEWPTDGIIDSTSAAEKQY